MTGPRGRSLADPSNADAGPMRVHLGHGGEVNRWNDHPAAGPELDGLLAAGPESPGAAFYKAARDLWVGLHRAGPVRTLTLARNHGLPVDSLCAFLTASPSRT